MEMDLQVAIAFLIFVMGVIFILLLIVEGIKALIKDIFGENFYEALAVIVEIVFVVFIGVIGGMFGYIVGSEILDNIIVKAIFSVIGFFIGIVFGLDMVSKNK